MALNAEEQELFDFAVAALPKWFTSDERQREELAGFAKIFGAALATVRYWFGQTLIGGAQGPALGLPDWLNQHAIGRGTRRQFDETTPALRDRLKNAEDAITRPALLAAVDAILVAEGIVGSAAMLELPRDGAHFGEYTSMTGVGGTFEQDGTTTKFTPDVLPWPAPPYRSATVAPVLQHELVIAGAADAANDGTRTVTGLEDDAALVTNAAGVAGVDAGVTWTVQRLDVDGNVTDGFTRAYLGRGYRMSRRRPRKFVIILPFGSTEGTASSVREMLRQKKAAGVKALIERRLNP